MSTICAPGRTLIRAGGVWSMRPAGEAMLSVEAMESADSVRGADKGTRHIIGGGRLAPVDDEIAEELRRDGFGGCLIERPDPPRAASPLFLPPVVDQAANTRSIDAMQRQLDAQAAEIAELRAARAQAS